MNCNSIKGKLDMIKANVETYKPDIVAVSETKIGDLFDDNEFLGDGYTVYRNDRKKGAGGTLIAVCNHSRLVILKTTFGPGESITIQIQIHPKVKINIIVYYRPPNEYSLDNLEALIDENIHDHCLYVGDFNLPDIIWQKDCDDTYIKPSSNRKAMHIKALELINDADLIQLIHEATHTAGNTLDLVMINKTALDNLHIACCVKPFISDHKMILTEISTQSFDKDAIYIHAISQKSMTSTKRIIPLLTTTTLL